MSRGARMRPAAHARARHAISPSVTSIRMPESIPHKTAEGLHLPWSVDALSRCTYARLQAPRRSEVLAKTMDTPTSLAQCTAMIGKLVGFPTVSRDSNLELIDFVREELRALNAEVRLTFDDDRRKANLFATLGPPGPGGLVLSGHTDVVPVEGQAWDTDPFALVEKRGRLYARGTSDMKSFIAVALALLPSRVS